MKLKTRVASLLLALMAFYAPTQAQFLERLHGTAGEEEVILDIKHTANGETVQVGCIYQGNDDNQSDALIMRVDATGNTVWSRRIVTQQRDLFHRVIIAGNGDYIAVGFSSETTPFGVRRRALICRYDATGMLIWRGDWAAPTNAYQNDQGPIFRGVRELANRDIIAVGSVNNDRPGGAGLVCSFNGLTGAMNWTRVHEGTGSNCWNDVVEHNSEIVVAGYVDDGAISRDGVIIRLDNSGTILGVPLGYSLDYNYLGNATGGGIPLDCIYFQNLYQVGARLFVSGIVTSDWATFPGGDNALIIALDAFWNGAPTVAACPPFTSTSSTFFIPRAVGDYIVGMNPGFNFASYYGIDGPTNDHVVSHISGLAVTQTTHPNEPGQKFLYAADFNNNNLYAAGVMRGGTVQIGEDDALNVYNRFPFIDSTECDVDSIRVDVSRPELDYSTPIFTVFTEPLNDRSDTVQVVPNFVVMSPCDSIPPPDDTTGEGCSEECYWRLVGNNVTPPENKFGTLNHQAVRFFTDNNQRGVLTADGEWGIRVNTVTTNIHMDAGTPPGSIPSGLRMENLPEGEHYLLYIDDDGYVYREKKHQVAKEGGSQSSDRQLQSQIDELKKQVEELKSMLGQGTGQTGATLSVAPNPTNGEFAATYSITQPFGTGELKITDVSGKVLMTKPLENNNTNGTIRVSLPKTISSEHIICTLICDGKVIASQKMVLINK